MATTVQDIYAKVCRMLLEDDGLSLVYSEGAFLSDLTVAVRSFLQATGMVKVYNSESVGTTGQYAISDTYMEIYEVFWNKRYLLKSHGMALDEADPFWSAQSGIPSQWKEDELAANTIRVAPKPAASGTLGYIASVQSASSALTMSDSIPYLPDSFCSYLPYFVLVHVFETEGESRDLNRAAYCRARRDEALNIAKAIMAEELADD